MGPEAKFRDAVVSAYRSMGAEVLLLVPSAANGLDEWPDAIVAAPGGRTFWIEFKAPRGRARRGQRKVLDSLRALGHTAVLAKGWRDLIEVTKALRGDR